MQASQVCCDNNFGVRVAIVHKKECILRWSLATESHLDLGYHGLDVACDLSWKWLLHFFQNRVVFEMDNQPLDLSCPIFLKKALLTVFSLIGQKTQSFMHSFIVNVRRGNKISWPSIIAWASFLQNVWSGCNNFFNVIGTIFSVNGQNLIDKSPAENDGASSLVSSKFWLKFDIKRLNCSAVFLLQTIFTPNEFSDAAVFAHI